MPASHSTRRPRNGKPAVRYRAADPVRLARAFLAASADCGLPKLRWGSWPWTSDGWSFVSPTCGRLPVDRVQVELALRRFVVADLEATALATGEPMATVTRGLVSNVLAVVQALADSTARGRAAQ
jgi:hypothetical protein